jgi:transcriptional regulator with XRE-family HTH domain
MTTLSISHAALSGPGRAALSRLGADLAMARARRGFSLREAAGRLLVSVNTLRGLEAGRPGVSLVVLSNALQLYGMLDRLAALADPAADRVGLSLERRKHRYGSKRQADFDV